MSAWIHMLLVNFSAARRNLRADDHGYATETVLVTALLVALALAVLAIIVVKVTQKANGINL